MNKIGSGFAIAVLAVSLTLGALLAIFALQSLSPSFIAGVAMILSGAGVIVSSIPNDDSVPWNALAKRTKREWSGIGIGLFGLMLAGAGVLQTVRAMTI